MNIVFLIIIGAAAGFIATRVMKVNMDILPTIGLGVLGAVIGGFVLGLLLSVAGIFAGFIGAVLGAMGLIWLWRNFGPKR